MKKGLSDFIKRTFAGAMAFVIGAFTCTANIISAAAAGEATVTMDKAVYAQGETARAEWKNITGSEPWYGVYKQGEATVGTPSTLWAYVSAGDGSTDFSDAQRAKWSDLTAGKYVLYIFTDSDASHIAAQTEFEIKASDAPDAPLKVSYTRTAQEQGIADGKVTVTDTESTAATGYALYWGDENGKFSDYSPFKVTKSSKTETTYSFNKRTLIPSGATRLYAYSTRGEAESENGVYTELDKNIAFDNTEKPYLKFAVMSDIHVTDNPSDLHNQHFDNALKDAKRVAPDNDVIILNGDITDFGQTAQYNQVNAIIKNNSDGLPDLMPTVGNHELRDATGYEKQIERFKKHMNVANVYYKKEYKDCTFIVLGSEATARGETKYNHSAYLSTAQLEWLEKTLSEAANSTKPIFLFCHQPLYNTVSGSLPGQDWDGHRQDAKLHAILKKYPQIIMITGHTHWELEARQQYYNGKGLDFSAFNDGSIGYLWTDGQQHKVGSQGLFVEVYKDKVIVKGYDYVNDCWISAAQVVSDSTQTVNEQAKSWTKDTATMMQNKANIEKAYNELLSLGDNISGGFSEAFELLKAAKTTLDGINKDVYTLIDKLALLQEQTKENKVSKTTLDECKALYASLSDADKALVPNAKTVIDNADRVYAQSNGKNEQPPTPNKDNNTGNNIPKNGTAAKNGKTILYKNGKAVSGTKIVTVAGKSYAVVKGYVKTGKGNRIVKIGSKSYVANKLGIIFKGKPNKRVKVGKKAYIVGKNGVVWKNKKSVKVGKKVYKVNKKGVATLKK